MDFVGNLSCWHGSTLPKELRSSGIFSNDNEANYKWRKSHPLQWFCLERGSLKPWRESCQLIISINQDCILIKTVFWITVISGLNLVCGPWVKTQRGQNDPLDMKTLITSTGLKNSLEAPRLEATLELWRPRCPSSVFRSKNGLIQIFFLFYYC